MEKIKGKKRYREDGTFYYYYYRKKTRKKKTGPKPKSKNKKKKGYDGSWNFKIVLFDFRKKVQYIGQYRQLPDVQKKITELLDENKRVEYPKAHVNNKRRARYCIEPISEYVVLKKIKEEGESNESLVRNDFGKLVKHTTTGGNYYVYAKYPHLVEETFWTFPFNPRTERRTFGWIRDNYVLAPLENEGTLVTIYLYNNKVIFRYDGDNLNFIVCKCISDAIKFYNLLSDQLKKNKRVFFTGMTSGANKRGGEIISLLMEKTGWPYAKVTRRNTMK